MHWGWGGFKSMAQIVKNSQRGGGGSSAVLLFASHIRAISAPVRLQLASLGPRRARLSHQPDLLSQEVPVSQPGSSFCPPPPSSLPSGREGWSLSPPLSQDPAVLFLPSRQRTSFPRSLGENRIPSLASGLRHLDRDRGCDQAQNPGGPGRVTSQFFLPPIV